MPSGQVPREDLICSDGRAFPETDTFLVQDLLDHELSTTVFDDLKQEVCWAQMFHRGGEVPRLVAVQGQVLEDGSIPIYRHPADESPPLRPFSPTVSRIKQRVEELLQHPVNHVLIQHYRHGGDYISEHSDKTIDVVRGTSIVNVSIGAQRAMTLRSKKDAAAPPTGTPPAARGERSTNKVPLPHNSMFVMGLGTNARWMHSIRTDKRPAPTKLPAEAAFGGARISLTFRSIGTYLTADGARIFGQGARGKTREEAGVVVNGGAEAERLIVAFGEENHRSVFDWDAAYGAGSDVLHCSPAVDGT